MKVNDNMYTATCILGWFGGIGKLTAMVNAKNFVYDTNSLKFKFSLCRKANICQVVYDEGKDLYTMKFYKYSPSTLESKQVETFSEVFGENLKRVFTLYTGLYLSL